jgi:maltose O-acetyltransferase
MGEMRERALRGELYIGGDADGAAEFGRAQELLAEFNGAPPGAWDERAAPVRRLLRHVGENVMVRPPFYCEYGEVSIEVPASPRTE